MDPFTVVGAVASIITLIDAATKVWTACESYIKGIPDHPEGLRRVYIDIKSFCVVLECLALVDADAPNHADMFQLLQGSDGPIEGCRKAIEALSSLIPPPTTTVATSRRKKRRLIGVSIDALAWPLKAAKVEKLLEDINRHKVTINMAIGGKLLQDVHAIKTSVTSLERGEIYKWLEHTNPSSNHYTACRLYEKGTCDWVLRTPAWTDWINQRVQCLWIHGIPGAGKTILIAHLIQHMENECRSKNDRQQTIVYYYCYHGRNQDESIPLLRWVISQLCRKLDAIPEMVYSLFTNGQDPHRDDLLSGLQAALSHFKTVFLAIDALDESHDRDNLLELLHFLRTDNRFDKLKLFVTSREYFDIETAMKPIATEVPISNPYVEEDIKVYIHAQMRKDRRFRAWPKDLAQEIEVQLSKGAKGMFRWAVCQLDILKRLGHESEIWHQIKNLPEGLDAAYERIFSLIPPEERALVKYALDVTWLFSVLGNGLAPSVTSDFLVETFIARQSLLQSSGQTLVNIERLKQSCGCLIQFHIIEEDGKMIKECMALAHFTVREYLESERASRGSSSHFRMQSGDEAYFASTAALLDELAHILRDDQAVDVSRKTTRQILRVMNVLIHAFYGGVCQDWSCHLDLVARFFDCSLAHYPHFNAYTEDLDPFMKHRALWRVLNLGHTLKGYDGGSCFPIFITMVSHGLFELAIHFVRSIEGPQFSWTTSFSITTNYPDLCPKFEGPRRYNNGWCFTGNIFELFAIYFPRLLGALAKYLARDQDQEIDYRWLLYLSAMSPPMIGDSFAKIGSQDLKWLIRITRTDGLGPYPVTPLQMAIATGNFMIAKHLLLDGGADPNACSGDGTSTCSPSRETLFLSPFNSLQGKSPLFILRNMKCSQGQSELDFQCFRDETDYDCEDEKREKFASGELEEILIERGAREFNLSEVHDTIQGAAV